MKRFVTASTLLMAIGSSFSAHAADPNPLGALFNALGSIGNPTGKTTGTSSSVSEEQIMTDLRTQAGSHGPTLTRYVLRAQIERTDQSIQAALDSGNYSQAARLSYVAAETFANVELQRIKFQNEQRGRFFADDESNSLSLADFAAMVGTRLVISLQAKKSSGMDIRNTIDQKTLTRANNFLSYAQAQGVPVASDTLTSLSALIGTETKASSESALSGSAEMIVEKYNGNRFGFDQKYLGKTITASGTVLSTRGNNSYAAISLLGNKKKSQDERGYNDEIACIITDPKSMTKAGDLTTGKNIKVRGVYDHDTHFNMMAGSQVNLSGCEILK